MRIMSNRPGSGIADCIRGIHRLSGGRGSLWRTVLGALFIGVLGNGMTLMNIDSYLQLFIKGVIIIVAVGLDRWRIGRDA